MNPIPVLYIDEQLIAVDKPAGMPVHGTRDPKRPHLLGTLEQQLDAAPGSLLPVHRLDAPTTGVVVVARNPAAADQLSAAFRERRAKKAYLAICECRGAAPPDVWREDNHLKPAPGPKSRPAPMRAVRSGGKRAITDFERLAHDHGRCLIVARPETGRRHQIRAHLACSGHPIIGDTLYGAAPAARLHLHAASLHLRHPECGGPLNFTAPTPLGFFAHCPVSWPTEATITLATTPNTQ